MEFGIPRVKDRCFLLQNYGSPFSRVCLAAVLMCHLQVIRSRPRMSHDGGHTSQYQGNCEGLRALPLNRWNVEFSSPITRLYLWRDFVCRPTSEGTYKGTGVAT